MSIVAQCLLHSTQEAEARGWHVLGQPGLYRKTYTKEREGGREKETGGGGEINLSRERMHIAVLFNGFKLELVE